MKTVTLINNFTNVVGQFDFDDIYYKIRDGHWEPEISPMRKLFDAGDMEGYDARKRKLPAVTFCASFNGGRTQANILEYNADLVGDIDHIPDDQLEQTRQAIIQCPYTRLCFLSPSGHGLKFVVGVNTGIKVHVFAFNSMKQLYEKITGMTIDPSGKDVTRLCFVSHDPKAYLNKDAKVFEPFMKAEKDLTYVRPDDQNTFIVYSRCIKNTESHFQFIHGQRNNFVSYLAMQLRINGQPEWFTLHLLLQDYNFNESEVRNCVRSAYNHAFPDNGPGRNYDAVYNTPADQSVAPVYFKTEAQNGPTGKKKKNKSIKMILEDAEAYIKEKYETRNNLVRNAVEWRYTNTNNAWALLDDTMVNTIFCELQHLEIYISINMLNALIDSNFNTPVDPFKVYIDSQEPWDMVTDHLGQLAATVVTHDPVYFDFCLRKWFVAYVAGLVVPEVFNHTLIVLIGEQGIGKSTWLKRILPDDLKDYLGTSLMLADAKDTAIQLSECGLIIEDELDTLCKKDQAMLKSVIASPGSRTRKPYARLHSRLIRRASLISSVNVENVLTDLTGSRRYLCFNVSKIDFKHKVDIGKCMAQAMAMFKSGFRFWFNDSEIHANTKNNKRFAAKSVEQEMIELCLEPVTREEWDNRNKFAADQNIKKLTATGIAMEIMGKTHAAITDVTVNKISKILKLLNYVQIRGDTSSAYLVRVLDGETVERKKRTTEENEEMMVENVVNDQNMNLKDDLKGGDDDGYLPF